MNAEYQNLLKSKCNAENFQKLIDLGNEEALAFIAEFVNLCNPDSIFVRTDSKEDSAYIRAKSVENKEEIKLKMSGHTMHFDGFNDQARDKKATKYLLEEGVTFGKNINSTERNSGLSEVKGFLKNSMEGKQMIVAFFCLGPLNSEFSISCLQITDSYYVSHSEAILYRSGYEVFKNLEDKKNFFRFVHSAGETENSVSKNTDKRRVYMDLKENTVFSTNTQYAGNTVGLKKLALRLAIQKASSEGWLAEHMFVMGVKGPSGRKTYFSGAYPSACGKTSTAMVKGESIIGDDIAYLRKIDGKVRAVNVEAGIFGIIRDVNSNDDPVIWDVLTTDGELIFSNVLMTEDGVPFWLGDNRDHPHSGTNFSGKWYPGKLDDMGNEITLAHKNARYTISLKDLKNCDEKLNDVRGVELGAIIYGGRDSDTWPPVQQSFDWVHGVISMGASLESETTAATIGKEGVRAFCPMSNLDFLAMPIGEYINNYCEFQKDLKKTPLIFSSNYFLRNKEGQYISGMEDKRVWLKWMELRVNGEVEAIKTPAGFTPKYDDLKKLFKEVLDKEYSQEEYLSHFTVRIPENLAKIERIEKIYKEGMQGCPDLIFKVLDEQKKRLLEFKESYGEYVDPSKIS